MPEPLNLDAVQALVDAATPGPWSAITSGVANGDHWYICDEGESIAMISANDGVNEDQREPDAEFIAATRTLVPALIAEVRRLQASGEAAEAAIARVQELTDLWEMEAVEQEDRDIVTMIRGAIGVEA
jgi:hypothetical protein